jgi:hypothetical protein
MHSCQPFADTRIDYIFERYIVSYTCNHSSRLTGCTFVVLYRTERIHEVQCSRVADREYISDHFGVVATVYVPYGYKPLPIMKTLARVNALLPLPSPLKFTRTFCEVPSHKMFPYFLS